MQLNSVHNNIDNKFMISTAIAIITMILQILNFIMHLQLV